MFPPVSPMPSCGEYGLCLPIWDRLPGNMSPVSREKVSPPMMVAAAAAPGSVAATRVAAATVAVVAAFATSDQQQKYKTILFSPFAHSLPSTYDRAAACAAARLATFRAAASFRCNSSPAGVLRHLHFARLPPLV
eukprot:SAG22_NODE_955_length_6331_cov_21.329108_5_plen_135_part_00